MQIGTAIKKLRKKAGYTQVVFCSHIGITQSYLSQIESDLKKPSIELLEKISDYLEVPLPIMFWFGIDNSDIPFQKLEHFKFIKPTIDQMIESIW